MATRDEVRAWGRGETVVVLAAGWRGSATDGTGYLTVNEGATGTISRVLTNRVLVRFLAHDLRNTNYDMSLWMDIAALELAATQPPRRKLGETPDLLVRMNGEDGMEYSVLPISDPRIQWIWADLATYAKNKRWCPEYDALCAVIGIPGRPRDFTVSGRINGYAMSFTVEAHNANEAIALVRAQLIDPAVELTAR